MTLALGKKKELKESLRSKAIEMALVKLESIVRTNPMGKGSHSIATGGDNARYGAVCFIDNDHLKMFSNQHPCHAYMKWYSNALVVYNQYGHRDAFITKVADVAWFNFITSDSGPWKEFSNRKVSEVPDGWPNKGSTESVKDFIWGNGWVWSDLSYPSNLQHNFLVAARMPAEWPHHINRWYSLVSKGCHPGLSFVVLDVFPEVIGDPKKFQINQVSNKYDWPIDVITAGEDYVRNFCQGRVENLIQPYDKDPYYKLVNRIFGVNTLLTGSKGTYPSVIFDKYSKDFGASKEEAHKYHKAKGSTSGDLSTFQYDRNWFVSEEDVISIINLEEKRLGLDRDH